MKLSQALVILSAVKAVDAFLPSSKLGFTSRPSAQPAINEVDRSSVRLFESSETTPAAVGSIEFSNEEESLIESIHAKFADVESPRDVLQETLPTLSPALVYRLRQAINDSNPAIQKVATELNDLLDQQLETARSTLKELLNAGEIRKLDSIIGKAQREGRLDSAFFNVLTVNLQDAANNDEGPTEEGAASRLQILQHIFTRCQEEVEKSIPPGLALLNKLLRTPQDAIRQNLYEHYLTPQKTKITSPDGKEIDLPSSGAPLVAMQDFIDAVSQTVKQIRTVENVGATDKVSAASMVESCRTVAKEARIVIGETYGVESDELRKFEEGLQPVFRPDSPESPYIAGEA